MKLGKNMATAKKAKALLEKIIDLYNNGYDALIISTMTGLKKETVEILLDIATAIEKQK